MCLPAPEACPLQVGPWPALHVLFQFMTSTSISDMTMQPIHNIDFLGKIINSSLIHLSKIYLSNSKQQPIDVSLTYIPLILTFTFYPVFLEVN